MSSKAEMERYIEEWKAVREEVISLGKGEMTVGSPRCSMELMYAIRAIRGQDRECNFTINQDSRAASILKDNDGNPLPTSDVEQMPTTPEEWEEWYALNEKIKSKSPIGLLVEKEKNILKEQELAARLAELENKISVQAANLGIVFDEKTGETQIDQSIEPSANAAANIEELAAELGMKTKPPVAKAVEVEEGEISRTGVEYSDSSEPTSREEEKTKEDDFGEIGFSAPIQQMTATSSDDSGNPSTGNEEKAKEQPQSIKSMAQEIMNHPALLKEINAIKEHLMDRDVKAKKVLDARRKLEVAKDAMDMDAAIYTVQKYRMQLEIATMKIALMRAVEQGKPHEADFLKRGIKDIAGRIAKLENDFAIRNEGHLLDVEGAKNNLQMAQKTVEMERKDNGVRNSQLLYSEEGLLKGMGVEVDVSGRTVNELELFDERGVIVEDVEDILSKKMSYNIEGTVVVRHTDVEADKDTTDVYHIGNMQTLEIETEAGTVDINEHEMYNAELSDNVIARGPEKSPSDPEWDIRRDLGRVAKTSAAVAMSAYVGAEMIKTAADLAELMPEVLIALRDAGLTLEQLGKLDSARKGAHPETRNQSLKEWIQGMGPELEKFVAEIFMDKFDEKQKEMDDPENDIGEIKPPPEAGGNNSNNY